MIIQADYIKNFHCDGKICGSRCCRDWKIFVDNETYQKFLQADDSEEILKNIEQENNSFVLKMTERGFCKFLDENFLCRLQKKHGENFLTAVCQSFPRITYKLSKDIFQQSMTLTCPVAAEKILLSEEKINFVEVQKINFSSVQKLNARMVIDFTKKLSYPAEKFLQIQTRAIKILQDRNFSINERLKNLCELFHEKIFSKFNIEKNSAELVEIFDEMYNANLTGEKKKILSADYIRNREKILSQVYENFSHVFENYLANEFFMRCYPCAFVGDDWTNCKIFVTSFRVLEFCLILTTISKKTLRLEDLINLICSVSDKLDHSKNGSDAIKKFAADVDDEKFFSEMIL